MTDAEKAYLADKDLQEKVERARQSPDRKPRPDRCRPEDGYHSNPHVGCIMR